MELRQDYKVFNECIKQELPHDLHGGKSHQGQLIKLEL